MNDRQRRRFRMFQRDTDPDVRVNRPSKWGSMIVIAAGAEHLIRRNGTAKAL